MPIADTFTAPDGQSIHLWRWPAKPGRATLHWAHATGFHGRMYAPLLDLLAAHLNVVAWDMRGHGASRSAGNPQMFRGWKTYYDDLATFLKTHDEPIWMAGHSVGGMTTLGAAAQMPEKVAGIFLIEPVLMDYFRGFPFGIAKLFGRTKRIKIVAGAARRQPHFPSRQDAYDNYRTKRAFYTWSDEWLQGYVEHGFVDDVSEEGTPRVSLSCQPAWESLTFSHAEHQPWRYLARLQGVSSIHALGGEHRSTFPPSARQMMKRYLPQAEIEEVADSSHFLPMEFTQQVAEWILERV
ncbi:MAG: alpha/beta hydrolase [Chloroflexota bacterium]